MNSTTRKYHRINDAYAIRRYKKPSKLRMAISYALFIGISYFLAHQAAIVIAKAEAESAARQEQMTKENQAKIDKERITAMCGGPEATPVPIGNGIYECVTKRGFKQRMK